MRDADIAMYYAKDNQENYVIFDQKMHTRAVTRLQLETDLRVIPADKCFKSFQRSSVEPNYRLIVKLKFIALDGKPQIRLKLQPGHGAGMHLFGQR